MRQPNFLAGGGLDRAGALRTDDSWVAAQLCQPENLWTPVWRARSWVVGGGSPDSPPRAGLFSVATADPLADALATVVLLGRQDGITYFAADLSHLEEPQSTPPLAGQGEFVDLRQVGALLSPPDGSLLAYARAIMTWHRRHGFCGVCGHSTHISMAGHMRVCDQGDCAAEHFPRTDPAVIMLVESRDRALLARQARWPPGVYSVLAGFVEPGESLEEAVAREVQEETGIVVDDVRYHSSQPWPFPSSLMLGFRATTRDTTIHLDGRELEDARWLSRQEIRDLKRQRELRLPSRFSIARRLIEDWLAEGS